MNPTKLAKPDRKFKVWLDSGANIHSCRQQVITLPEIGLTPEEWDAFTDEEKDEVMKEVAWDRSDWGFVEVTEGDE